MNKNSMLLVGLAAMTLIPTISVAQERVPLARLSQQGAIAPKLDGFTEWQARLDRAKSARRNARNTMLIGAGIMAAGVVVGILVTGTSVDEIGNLEGSPKSGLAVTMIGGLGGAAVMGYGGWKYVSARDNIEDLDREGRTKGFLSVVPLPEKGVRVALRLTF